MIATEVQDPFRPYWHWKRGPGPEFPVCWAEWDVWAQRVRFRFPHADTGVTGPCVFPCTTLEDARTLVSEDSHYLIVDERGRLVR